MRLIANDKKRAKTYHALEEVNLDFDQAKEKAEDWLEQMTCSAVRKPKRGTVREALEAYLADLRQHDRYAAAKDAQWRVQKYVLGNPDTGLPADPLADLRLESATRDDFTEWRERQRTGGRENRTVNRNVRAVIAGLNRSVELGQGNPLAWKLTSLADDTEDSNQTAVFLTPAQRVSLLAAAEPSTADLLRGIDYTGARPLEVANTLVSDFDGASIKLSHRKGRPPKLRVRYTTLSAEGVEFFTKMAEGKPHNAPLFKPARLENDNDRDQKEPDERLWTTHLWGRRVRAAVDQHNKTVERAADKIPEDASAYSLRHARISELLQVYNIDPITVAQQTGTSVAMIEKTYFKFIQTAMRAKTDEALQSLLRTEELESEAAARRHVLSHGDL